MFGAPASFSFGAPAAAAAAPTPAAAFSFGAPAATAAPAAPAPAFSFGAAAAPATAASVASAPAFSFGVAAPAPAAAAATAAAPAPAAFSFGVPPAAAAAAPAPAAFSFGAPPAAAAAAPAPAAFSFGAPPAAAAAAPAAPATAAAAASSEPAPSAAATAAAASSSSSGLLAAGPPPSDLSTRTVGEILRGWQDELAGQAAVFGEQAEQVGVWDAVLRRHVAGLGRLAEDTAELRAGQAGLDGALDAIDANQRMMEGTLERLEGEMDAILGAAYAPGSSLALGGGGGSGGGGGGGGGLAAVDDVSSGRLAAYTCAQEVDGLLGTYSGVLRGLVERLNALQLARGGGGEGDPLEVVRSILDAQVGALAYVDREATQLLAKARQLDHQLAGYGN